MVWAMEQMTKKQARTAQADRDRIALFNERLLRVV
jgi:hypothetical protein